eukprot:350891-Chlamydomonas_euryale.AAC.11
MLPGERTVACAPQSNCSKRPDLGEEDQKSFTPGGDEGHQALSGCTKVWLTHSLGIHTSRSSYIYPGMRAVLPPSPISIHICLVARRQA